MDIKLKNGSTIKFTGTDEDVIIGGGIYYFHPDTLLGRVMKWFRRWM